MSTTDDLRGLTVEQREALARVRAAIFTIQRSPYRDNIDKNLARDTEIALDGLAALSRLPADAVAVAWINQRREWTFSEAAALGWKDRGWEVTPLYAAPPSPPATPHKHSDACWEPNSGCDMGRSEEHVRVSVVSHQPSTTSLVSRETQSHETQATPDAEAVERFNLEHWGDGSGMRLARDGYYVRHADHERVVAYWKHVAECDQLVMRRAIERANKAEARVRELEALQAHNPPAPPET